MPYTNIAPTSNRILIEGTPHIEWYNVESNTGIYPGSLVQIGSTDKDVIAGTPGCNPIGWIGFQHTKTEYTPNGIDTLHNTGDEASVLIGAGFFLTTTLEMGEIVSKNDPLMPGNDGMVKKWTSGNIVVAYAWESVDATSGNTRIAVESASSWEAPLETSSNALFASYLTTQQDNIHNGANTNVFENVEINDIHTVDSNSQITIGKTGRYRISYTAIFHQTGGSDAQIMASWIKINGVDKRNQTEARCYIRDTVNGDQNHTTNSYILSLNSGDTINLYSVEDHGGQTTDLINANIAIEEL